MSSNENPNPPAQNQAYGTVRAENVLSGMQSGESPLDFIRKNTKTKTPINSPMPPAAPDVAPPPPPPAATPPVDPDPVYSLDSIPSLFNNAPVTEPPKEAPSAPPPVTQPSAPPPPADAPAEPPIAAQDVEPEPDFDSDTEIPPAAKNFKSLRTKYKVTAQSLKERDAEAQTLRDTISKYEAGEILPKVVEGMRERLAELEPLETVHRLKTSPAYKAKFVEPLLQKTEKLKSIGKSYNIPDEVMEQVLEITDDRELNQFLSNNFDGIGGLEAKQHITAIQSLRAGAKEAETEPERALASIETEHAAAMQLRDAERRNSIASSAKTHFTSAFSKVLSKANIPSLMPRDNDPEYNEKFGPALQQKIATDYGKMVTELASLGITELPQGVAEALANFAIYGITGMIHVQEAEALRRELDTHLTNTNSQRKYIRPSFGGAGGGGTGGAAPTAPKAASPQEASRNLINGVLARQR